MCLSQELEDVVGRFLAGEPEVDDLLDWVETHVQTVYDARVTDPTAQQLHLTVWEAADAFDAGRITDEMLRTILANAVRTPDPSPSVGRG